MLKIAICDDEKYFRKEINDILIPYLNEKGIVHSIDAFDSGEEFVLRGLEMLKYDVVFLDINMERMDGLETARKIREYSKDVFIVFVTAYIDYTLEGYKVDAIRYILKNNSTLKNAVEECMDAIQDKMNYSVNTIEFEFLEGKKSILLDRILYIESNLHKLIFYIMEDTLEKYTLYMTLDELENKLSCDRFLRIHQSYLVNIAHVGKVVRYSLFTDNGTELSIPKARYKEVQRAVAEYKGAI